MIKQLLEYEELVTHVSYDKLRDNNRISISACNNKAMMCGFQQRSRHMSAHDCSSLSSNDNISI